MTTSSDALVSTTVTPHSPLPWRIEVHPDNDVTYIRPAGDGDFWVDAMPMYHDGRNAEFIVRACNTHGDLLAALKEARIFIAKDYPDSSRAAGNWPTVTPVIDRIDAAIAKAEA